MEIFDIDIQYCLQYWHLDVMIYLSKSGFYNFIHYNKPVCITLISLLFVYNYNQMGDSLKVYFKHSSYFKYRDTISCCYIFLALICTTVFLHDCLTHPSMNRLCTWESHYLSVCLSPSLFVKSYIRHSHNLVIKVRLSIEKRSLFQ